jgi:membrane fusion protein (multidrug efflux system)
VTTGQSLFRQEALQAQDDGKRDKGALLRLTPRWLASVYPLLLCVVAGSLSFASFATVDEFASGPAVVRVESRVDLTAGVAGTVEALLVTPGQRVEAGAPLVRFKGTQEKAELERLDSELEGQLVRLLRDPGDQAARQALTSLRAARTLAAARLADRVVIAPGAGIVSDVRIRPGELLQAGDHVLSLIGEGTRFYVVALLPGSYRPLLHAGQTLRLALNGFQRSSELVTIESVGDQVIGPAEARRFLGPDVADALTVDGPVVLVKATLRQPSFAADKKRFNYYDGLPGRAEARVRSQRVVALFIPGLTWLVGDGA